VNVDWDLLADHLGGALDGTPEGARVERLVATDPGWSQAARELSTALDAVAADLRTLPVPTLPDDVAARLDAALGTAPARDVRPGGSPATVRADESRRPPTHPGTRRRRRMTRWSAGLAVAAGVATFAAIGLGSWLGTWDASTLTPGVNDEEAGDAAAPEQPPNAFGGEPSNRESDGFSPLVVATGSDYQEETLANTSPPPAPGFGNQDQPTAPPQAPSTQVAPDEAPDSVLPPLFRLWTDPEARAACLNQIVGSLTPPPVTINTVDFASFEGQPALVIWATTGDARRWAWVSGPDCGRVVGDPDLQFETEQS
jgi:hypothetical protein